MNNVVRVVCPFGWWKTENIYVDLALLIWGPTLLSYPRSSIPLNPSLPLSFFLSPFLSLFLFFSPLFSFFFPPLTPFFSTLPFLFFVFCVCFSKGNGARWHVRDSFRSFCGYVFLGTLLRNPRDRSKNKGSDSPTSVESNKATHTKIK